MTKVGEDAHFLKNSSATQGVLDFIHVAGLERSSTGSPIALSSMRHRRGGFSPIANDR